MELSACGLERTDDIENKKYTTVFEASDKIKGVFIAKYIKNSEYDTRFGMRDLNEINILSSYDHPYIDHITSLRSNFDCKINGVLVVRPFVSLTLKEYFENYSNFNIKGFEMKHMNSILVKIAKGLSFLHDKKIGHFSLDLDNVIFYCPDKLQPRITNFELSQFVLKDKPLYQDYGSYLTMAPETFLGYSHHILTLKSDVWSFGMLFMYCLTLRYLPFDSVLNPARLKYLLDHFSDQSFISKIDLTTHVNRSFFNEMLRCCLQVDYRKRGSIHDVINIYDKYYKLNDNYKEPEPEIKLSGSIIVNKFNKYIGMLDDILRSYFNYANVRVFYIAYELFILSNIEREDYDNDIICSLVASILTAIHLVHDVNNLKIISEVHKIDNVFCADILLDIAKDHKISKEDIFIEQIRIISAVEGRIGPLLLFDLVEKNRMVRSSYNYLLTNTNWKSIVKMLQSPYLVEGWEIDEDDVNLIFDL